MTDLKVEVDPGEVGFDAKRLDRIEQYLRPYVDEGKLPGWLVTVARDGKLAYVADYGRRDMEADLPVEHDTIWRIYSMTKPITSLAAMMLWEQGLFDLNDPVEDYIPSFKNGRVYAGGSPEDLQTTPVREPVRVWHLLSHTAGLSYGWSDHPVDQCYRNAQKAANDAGPVDLAGAVDAWAGLPLVFEPGTHWLYSHATDVVGRFVEVVSGQSLDTFFAEHIFGPLGMTDTAFSVGDDKADRLASLYVPDSETRKAVPSEAVRSRKIADFPSGGGGLFGTAGDYYRFCELLRAGGELDGVRLVGPKTIRMMASNHLPGGVDLDAMVPEGFAEGSRAGAGFGLGFSVVLNPAATKVSGSRGAYSWGGAAATVFWIDPREQITASFYTQLLSSPWPIGSRLRQLVYQALVEPTTGRRRG